MKSFEAQETFFFFFLEFYFNVLSLGYRTNYGNICTCTGRYSTIDAGGKCVGTVVMLCCTW